LIKEIFIDDYSINNIYYSLEKFLKDNIFKIEKDLKNFIKKINLIIKSENFSPMQLSLKQNNNDNTISQQSLNYLLNEAKNQCKKSMKQKKIIHMIIDNYLIDNKNFAHLPEQMKCHSFSLDISFICLQLNVIEKFEKILKKYQISLNQILDANYIESFFNKEDIDIFNMGNKIINGVNRNEVKIINKKITKSGLFERFFNLFS
jgi:cell division ATPase FtsA